MIFSDQKDTEKAFDNIQYPFTIKILSKWVIEKTVKENF